MFSCSLLFFIFPAAALSSFSSLSLYSQLLLCLPVRLFSLYSLLLLIPLFPLYIPCCCSVFLFSSLFIFPAAMSLCSSHLFIFPAAAMFSCSPISLYSLLLLCSLVLPFCLYSLLLLSLPVPLLSIFPAATLPSYSSLYIPCCCPVLFPSLFYIFPAAALSFFLPLSLYSLLLFCPFSSLLFIFSAAIYPLFLPSLYIP